MTAADAALAAGEAPVEPVRRLHPGTIGIAILRRAPSTLLGLPAVLAITSDVGILLAIGLALAATAIAAGVSWLTWRRFTYTLTDDAVVIESGILSRNRRVIPFARVQDVDIERRLLARVFGLAKVSLETGGSGEDEGDLDSVSLAEAHRLRDAIRSRAAGEASIAAADPHAEAVAADALFAMRLPRVLGWGLFNFSLVWLAVIFGALQYLQDFTGIDLRDRDLWETARDQGARFAVQGAAWAVLAVALGLMGVVAGLVRTLLRDFGFVLTDEGDRLRRVRGLLTHSETVIARKRIQLARVDSGWLRRRLGYARLRVQTLSGEGEDDAARPELAPHATADEVARILDRIGHARPAPEQMRRVSSGHVWRAVTRQVGLPAAAIALAALATPFALLALPLLAPVLAVALVRRRYHRYGFTRHGMEVQRGVLDRETWIVPARNVQAVAIRRTWLQRRLGTATVFPDTAGGSRLGGPAIHDVRVADAWRIADVLRVQRGMSRPRP